MQIVGVARHDSLPVAAGADRNARVDRVAAVAKSEQQAHNTRGRVIEGHDVRAIMLQQSRQARLTAGISEHLSEHTSGNVQGRTGLGAGPQ